MSDSIWINEQGVSLNANDVDDAAMVGFLVDAACGRYDKEHVREPKCFDALFKEASSRFPEYGEMLQRLHRCALFTAGFSIDQSFRKWATNRLLWDTAKDAADRYVRHEGVYADVCSLADAGVLNKEETVFLLQTYGYHDIHIRIELCTGVLGKPKFQRGDSVSFECNGQIKVGLVEIVDAYGTFDQNVEPSYDILVKSENTLYKHFRETLVRKVGD